MKSLVCCIVMMLGIIAGAQDIKVPSEVVAAFDAKYPSAEDVVWKQKKGTYQAEFFDSYQTIAMFSPEGKWMKTISLVSEDDLPDIAYEYVDEIFGVSQILQVHKIEDNKLKVTYKVVIIEDSERIELNFTDDGDLIK